MAAFARRFCALPLLCAVLVLAAVLVSAESSTVTGDVTMLDKLFDSDTITLDLSASTAAVVTVQLINSQVSGGGLTVRGAVSSQARLSMSVTGTTVTQATIFFTGPMPSNADIRIVSTTGTLASAQSLFDFSGLVLDTNVTLVVENTAVTWPQDARTAGSVLLIGAGSNSMVIKNNAAVFVLNANAVNGASVVSVDIGSDFALINGGVFAIDYSRCDKCSRALVDIQSPLTATGSSLFRLSNCKVIDSSNSLLTSAGGITVAEKSAYLIHDSAVASGSLFSFPPDGQGSYSFVVSGGSIVSFLNLEGPATGVASELAVPSTADNSKIMGGGCKIAGVPLTDLPSYSNHGLQVNALVRDNGLGTDNTCANANCIPGYIQSGTSTVTPCTCKCSTNHKPPSCTLVVDPTLNYKESDDCIVPNCATCDRLNPTTRCTACNAGYKLTNTHTCESTAVITSSTAPTAPSGAAGAHTTALAVAVCVAATLYAL
ncbi:hypothetical protein LSCM4_07468 [Leishmania orientalis]|uniref:Surface antigen-like protein n=1 Tax=Leishmania orientalis TaxID=2249476 RepID=A0A836KYN3_9TRYP|nr:hypothetical protein LSCM4_07468 [Leishmania orientalis]